MSKKLYIVTNFGGGENYTPSVFNNKEDARAWLKECTAENIYAEYSSDIEDEDIDENDYDAIITFGKSACVDVEYDVDYSVVGDIDSGGGNIMQLFEVNTP